MIKYIPKLLPHICIVLSCIALTLLIIDKFNTKMNFINNDITKNGMIVLCALTVICSAMLAHEQRKSDRED